TLDPLGLGIEMEAGKPGWYDALNGLPGLFGSSLCETYELERWLTFLLEAMAEKGPGTVELPIEQVELMERVVEALEIWCESDDPDRDFYFWDTMATARETYRERVRLGFGGEVVDLPVDELGPMLAAFQAKVLAGIQRAVEMNDGIPPTYLSYTVTDYDLITDAEGEPQRDQQSRPYVRAQRFEPTVLPLFLEGPVHALKVQPDVASARNLYAKIRKSDLYDLELGMYKVNASLEGQPHEIGRARAFTPGWLENESIWLHMEYKYLLEVLKAGLHEEFFADLKRALVCFQDPAVYGRSPLENSSFLVSSAHPDESLHGAGFVARLSGATAEFLSIWTTMMAGQQPFFLRDGTLCLQFKPSLPGWLFDTNSKLIFTFLGRVQVTYHNPNRRDLFPEDGVGVRRVILHLKDEGQVELGQSVIGDPYAQMIRAGQITDIDVYFQADGEFDR
ncbi:MAG: cellobiose phosphorylase, partial [Anaerolineae bacterium]